MTCREPERVGREPSPATPFPTDRPWYRQLLVIVAAMGAVIGLLGLVYLAITGELTDRVFGDPRIDAWSGDWWWIPFTAAGGLLAAGLRAWWKIPDQVRSWSSCERRVRPSTIDM